MNNPSPRRTAADGTTRSAASSQLEDIIASSRSVQQAFAYRKFANDRLTILFFAGQYPLKEECMLSLQRMGHRVVEVEFDVMNPAAIKKLLMDIAQAKPDFLLSINHRLFDAQGSLGRVLDALKIPLAVWYVDSPLFNMKSNSIPAPAMSTLFLWERELVERVKSYYQFHNVHYLPLATSPELFCRKGAIKNTDTVFVGDSMEFARKKWKKMLTLKGWQQVLAKAETMESVGRTGTHELTLPDSSREAVEDIWWDEITAATWQATASYRKKLLAAAADSGLVLYGDEGWKNVIPKGDYRGKVAYGADLSSVFESSQISLNATSFQMPTAVNQRVFDVPASGGFILTDDVADLHEHFIVGKEIVAYNSADQLSDFIRYYRTHDTERLAISERAEERIKKQHTYVHRLSSMLDILRNRHA